MTKDVMLWVGTDGRLKLRAVPCDLSHLRCGWERSRGKECLGSHRHLRAKTKTQRLPVRHDRELHKHTHTHIHAHAVFGTRTG